MCWTWVREKRRRLIDLVANGEVSIPIDPEKYKGYTAAELTILQTLLDNVNNQALLDHINAETSRKDLKELLLIDYYLQQFEEEKKQKVEARVFEILNKEEGIDKAVQYAALELYEDCPWRERRKRQKELKKILREFGGLEKEVSDGNLG